jgi:DNA-binding CsgD family transcriptional regulator
MTKKLESFITFSRELEKAPGFIPSVKRYPFSPQQRAIASLVLVGKTNHAIALKMNINVSTVKDHCTRIFKIAGVANRHEFMAKFLGAPHE